MNAHEDGCFKFLGGMTNLTWLEAMVACEKVFSVGSFPQWVKNLFVSFELGRRLFSRAQDQTADGVSDGTSRA